VIEIEKW